MRTFIALIALLFTEIAYGYLPASKNVIVSTRLFAHHVEKKIIMKKMHNRPKKHRPSDINRSNVNFGKCITKLENSPADYTIISADDYAKIRVDALKFWESGSPTTPWMELTDEDKTITLPQNIVPLPVGGVQKRPNIVKSGSC
jgi:hypothetical protein